MSKIGINWKCFCNMSGYSIAAQDMIMSLVSSCKYDVKVESVRGTPYGLGISKEKLNFLKGLINKNYINNGLDVFHCIPILQTKNKNRNKIIGYATFETYDPPLNWINILNGNDAVIAPSEFNVEVFRNSGVHKPIFHIPHCLDFNIYSKNVSPLKKYDKFSFLFIGTWKQRKGYIELLEAWCSEFSKSDCVQLVIKTDKPHLARTFIEGFLKQKYNNKDVAPIIIESTVYDEKRMPQFIKSHDALVSPTYGEGFYIAGLQAMALGIPVIITNFSGCKDYANQDTAFLLEPKEFKIIECLDKIPQFSRKKWAVVSPSEISLNMRLVKENSDLVKEKTEAAYNYVKENFNYAVTAKKFDEMIGKINV